VRIKLLLTKQLDTVVTKHQWCFCWRETISIAQRPERTR